MIFETLIEAKKRWYLVLAICSLGAAGAYFYANTLQSRFVGTLTFVVDESSASGGGLGSIVGKLGLGSLNPTGVNLDRIIEFSKSEFVTKKVLEDSMHLDTPGVSIANYLVDYYEMPRRWEEAESKSLMGFPGFSYEINLNDRIESRVFQLLHGGIHRGVYDQEPLSSISYNAATGIFKIASSTLNEELSYSLCYSMYNNLKDVYTGQAGEKDAIVIRVLSAKQDSLNSRLSDLSSAYNREIDKNTGVVLSRNRQRIELYERDILQTTALLREIVQNVELTKFRMLTITPAFKTIDSPHYPLRKTRVSKSRYVLAGLILSLFLCFAFFLTKIAYKQYLLKKN